MADVIRFSGTTLLPELPEKILEKAKTWGMERCVIVGINDKHELVFGGSFCEAGDIILLLELAKKFVLENNFERTQ